VSLFVDEAEISVWAGNGGSGIVSFRREKFVPKGGPDGGDGGDGGDVVLVAEPRMASLLDFQRRRHIKADSGRPGGANCRAGRSGKRVTVRLPVGTVVHDADTGEAVGDLATPGAALIVAFGGIGGRGNTAFKSSTRQTPRFCEKGEKGEKRRLRLELKLLADVGLVGLPNAGKSSFLARVSAARPKVADYPFTTLAPNLGVVRIDAASSCIIADIPGLIEGAHGGAGLGHEFLRHVERTRLLIHIVDVARFERPDPMADYHVICRELVESGRGLAELPRFVALNKIDIADREDVAALAEDVRARGEQVYLISAATGEGVEALMGAAAARVNELREAMPPAEPAPPAKKRRRERLPIRVLPCDDGGYSVSGTEPEQAVARLPLETEGGVLRLHELLAKMGVLDALENLGAKDGDLVRIGEVELDYVDAASVFDDFDARPSGP